MPNDLDKLAPIADAAGVQTSDASPKVKKPVNALVKTPMLSLSKEGQHFARMMGKHVQGFLNRGDHQEGDRVVHPHLGEGKVIKEYPDSIHPKHGKQLHVRFPNFDLKVFNGELVPKAEYHGNAKVNEEKTPKSPGKDEHKASKPNEVKKSDFLV